MKIFDDIYQVPKHFTGVCNIIKYNSIRHYKNGCLHREDGPAIKHENGGKSWFYKSKNYGSDNAFTNKTWKEKVKELKREDELKIFI